MTSDGSAELPIQRAEALSSGQHGGIHLLNAREKGLYPGADLVKETRTDDPFDAERSFLELRIAGTLFPGSVIEVVGFEVLEPENQFPFRYLQMLYSKKADVPDAHLKYSTDMTLLDRGLGKVSTHDCSDCVGHRDFHEQNDLEGKYRQLRGRMGKAGIFPAGWNDSSDYCLTPNGLIAFEIGDFSPRQVHAFLDSSPKGVADPEAILKMLERYDQVPTVEQATGKPRRR